MTWVFANDHNYTVTTNDFALVAHWFNGGINLHFSLRPDHL